MIKKNVSPATIIALVVLVLAIAILFPFAVIWALNTLFGTAIAYGFWEWLAVLVLSTVINGTKVNARKD